jgi:hypothetical protein
MTRKVSLMCGIVSSLLYVGMIVLVPMQGDGYSSASQTVSELSAIGAPTRPLSEQPHSETASVFTRSRPW